MLTLITRDRFYSEVGDEIVAEFIPKTPAWIEELKFFNKDYHFFEDTKLGVFAYSMELMRLIKPKDSRITLSTFYSYPEISPDLWELTKISDIPDKRYILNYLKREIHEELNDTYLSYKDKNNTDITVRQSMREIIGPGQWELTYNNEETIKFSVKPYEYYYDGKDLLIGIEEKLGTKYNPSVIKYKIKEIRNILLWLRQKRL